MTGWTHSGMDCHAGAAGLVQRRTVQPNVSAATGVESVNPASAAKKKVRDISEAFPSSHAPDRGRTKQQVVGNYPSKARGRPRNREIQRA